MNFRIANDKNREEKVVRHDRISPVKGEAMPQPPGDNIRLPMPEGAEPLDEPSESSDSNSDVHSECEPSSESSSGEEPSIENDNPALFELRDSCSLYDDTFTIPGSDN